MERDWRSRRGTADCGVCGSLGVVIITAHGLVDELHLMIGPKIVAGNHHAFAGVPETELRLLDVRRWDDSDNVVLRDATAPA
jgi:riboflavin biosynthesis pyrimidine reductase